MVSQAISKSKTTMDILSPDQLQELEAMTRRAGAELMKHWPGRQGGNAGLKKEIKTDGSIVTEADFASNRILVADLQRLFPGDAITSEELKGNSGKSGARFRWIIDPLDGTKMFAGGSDDFAVLVGRVDQGAPVYGAMYFPARNLFAFSQKGQGAWQIDAEGNLSQILASDSGAVRDQGFFYKERGCYEKSKVTDPRVYPEILDSCSALFGVANGRFDALALKGLAEWDLAAPSAIIEGALGRITDEKGASLLFNGLSDHLAWFVATNGRVHFEVVDKILPKFIGSKN